MCVCVTKHVQLPRSGGPHHPYLATPKVLNVRRGANILLIIYKSSAFEGRVRWEWMVGQIPRSSRCGHERRVCSGYAVPMPSRGLPRFPSRPALHCAHQRQHRVNVSQVGLELSPPLVLTMRVRQLGDELRPARLEPRAGRYALCALAIRDLCTLAIWHRTRRKVAPRKGRCESPVVCLVSRCRMLSIAVSYA